MALDARPRLTDLSHGAGCACKIGPGQLQEILAGLPAAADPALLVGAETRDDAGVYRLSDDLALVQTVDFFTPIVDDPRDFGRIAAANALSDVYAMGARPLTALNLVAFSLERLGGDVLAEILAGGAEIAAQRRRADRRRALDRRSRAQVRHGRHRRRPPARHRAQLHRPRRGRAVPDQADRRRRGHDGCEARPRGRRRRAALQPR